MSNQNQSSTPPQAKTTANRYDGIEEKEVEHINKGKVIDLAWCISYFGKRGKEAYGEKFKIYQDDYEILYKLIIYFLAHQEESKRLNIDIRKGLLLTGPVGCGKTTLMNLMRLIPPPEKQYVMKACRDISFEFIQEGYNIIDRYSKLSFTGHHPKAYCFDDLGAEQSLKFYGNECNVMAEIILSRYDQFQTNCMVTHLTTNLSASEIQGSYGTRIRSRMREMFNVFHSRMWSDKRH